ncbi:MAG TPA: hypothetical protein VFT13_00685 [Candidatus Krumholzibacteria bacterium]|nr:hypothetical protein [Candidatus Krumholzibacteria bacterium]
MLLLLAAVTGAGCADDPVTPGNPPPPAPIAWSQLRGGLGVGEIRSVWGTSPQNLLAAHAAGILRYDGSAWRPDPVPPSLPALNAVWGAQSGAPFAAGDEGTLLRYNGASWVEMTSPTAYDIGDVHGRSASDVFAVASTRSTPDDVVELLHFDGIGWASIASRSGVDGNAVFAVPGMVFVVCDAGLALRHDGATLHEDDTLVAENLLDVWAASATDAYAVGESGRILRWDGVAWSPMTSGVTTRLRAVSGASSSDITAVGDGGLILHYDGVGWSSTPGGTTASLAAAWMLPFQRSVAGGEFGTVLFGSNAQWAPRNLGQPFTFEAVWSTSDYYMAVGTGPDGGVARDRDGFGWTFPGGLHAISGFGLGYVAAAGDDGAIYRFDGGDWAPEASPTASTLRGMTALVSRFGEPFRIYAAGDNGALIVWKGGGWTTATLPAGAEGLQFVDVWAAAIDDVFAVASNSTSIVRYDDPYELGDWTLEVTPATSHLLAVGGWRADVYIASEAGEIFFNNGGGWQPVPSPVTTPIRDIRALSETSIFAAGDGGVILHFNGSAWRKTDSGFPGNLTGVWGAEGRSMFAVGVEGAVLVLQD